MKNQKKQVMIVVTVNDMEIESIREGEIDLADPRFKTTDNVYQMEIAGDEETIDLLVFQTQEIARMLGNQAAVIFIDAWFVMKGRVTVKRVTTGDAKTDKFLYEQRLAQGDFVDMILRDN